MVIANLYNGYQLPPLPEYDTEKYPYAVILTDSTAVVARYLYLSTTPLQWYAYLTTRKLMATADGSMICYRQESDAKYEIIFSGGFVRYESGDATYTADGTAVLTSKYLKWANYDVINNRNTTAVYLEASDPIPVNAVLCNDVRVPPLPEVDSATYPYMTLVDDGEGYYWLVASSAEPTYDGAVAFGGTTTSWLLKESGVDWRSFGILDSLTYSPLWTNYDLKNADGSIYLAASEPVPEPEQPEEPETPDPAPVTPYLPINGAWAKHDIYKQVGNSWVKQPQGAVEVEGGAWSALS